MIRLPDSVRDLIERLSELPSIGPRQATRLVFYLIGRGKDMVNSLARDVDGLKKVKICERCFFIHENVGSFCDVCANKNRQQNVIMVVEKETDLLSLENTGKYTGRYFILGAIHKTGILEEWQKLRLQNLKSFIQKELGGLSDEVIIALNPSSAGDYNAGVIRKELNGLAKKVSRLGRGLPTGGEIEFADDETLGAALERRS